MVEEQGASAAQCSPRRGTCANCSCESVSCKSANAFPALSRRCKSAQTSARKQTRIPWDQPFHAAKIPAPAASSAPETSLAAVSSQDWEAVRSLNNLPNLPWSLVKSFSKPVKFPSQNRSNSPGTTQILARNRSNSKPVTLTNTTHQGKLTHRSQPKAERPRRATRSAYNSTTDEFTPGQAMKIGTIPHINIERDMWLCVS